jgi:hypothetical protein
MRAKLELTTITLGVSKIHWQNLHVCMLQNFEKLFQKPLKIIIIHRDILLTVRYIIAYECLQAIWLHTHDIRSMPFFNAIYIQY